MNCRIVVADDHQIMIDGLKMLLEKSGLNVVGEAKNGREAVELSASLQADIVIMDMSMPELNGIDAAKEIAKVSPQTNVIIYTMHAMESLLIKMRQAGIAGVVFKEDPPQELIKAVEIVYRGGLAYGKYTNLLLSQAMGEAEPKDGSHNLIAALSPREKDIFMLFARGASVKSVAETLKISFKTVETHKYNIFNKLSIDSLVGLVRFAMQNGLVND